ncbi:MAG: molybdopterin-dependent oxidoreductase [Thermoanaerobacteraceae bacterium]|nr:molybdopterin-dependent oxidoreductase [Thermoanaerobacteraceae bacterium]
MQLSRRSFLKAGIVLGGTSALAAGSWSGWGLKGAAPAGAEEEVKIVPTACNHNCGGRCVLKAHVRNGVITRITTDDEPDTPETPQLRACLRGRAYRNRLYHPDRLKFPLKRTGERGEGKFERITWDEAIDTIARELRRIKETYGPEAIYVNYATGNAGVLSGGNLIRRLLSLYGGYLNYYNNYSNPCVTWALNYTFGDQNAANSREDLVNSKLIILWGFNPAETIHGTNTIYYLRRAKEAGARIIVVDPRYSDTVIALADQWIPIRPTTDNALMDAMAYVMITEGLHDQAFLDKYCLGFDDEHLPEGVPPGNSYKSYVLGLGENKTPKTPEWAERITGVPKETIIQLAREYATVKPAALICGFGVQRHAYGEQPPRGAAVLAAMTGNIGRSGGFAGAMGYPGYGRGPKIGSVSLKNPVQASIPCFLWTEAAVRGVEMGPADGVQGVDRLPTNIKLIFNLAGNALINQHADVNRTAEILRDEKKVEFIVVSEQFMTPSARFADILLPVNTWMERNDICTPWGWGDYVLFMNKAIDSMYECKSEYEWISMLAERLGLGQDFTEGRSEEDWLRYVVEETRKNHPDFPSFEEFRKRGVYKFSYPENFIAFKEQIEDPENNPFPTPSGKIEIFSPRLWEMNNPREIPAVPKYIPAWEGPEDPLRDKYPLQCIGWHYRRRTHSTFDNVPWMEEVAPQVMWMNPQDAAPRGIKDGDRVKVFNDRGALMINVKVTPRIMPGVVAIPQGAWWTPGPDGVDQRGCINVLTSSRPTPLAKANPQHTNLVEVAKV